MKNAENEECLIVAQYYYPERIGSAPYCTELAEWLVRSGVAVKVITCRPHYPSSDEFAVYHDGSHDRETINGVEVLRVPTRQRTGSGAAARLRSDLDFVGRALLIALKGRLSRASTMVVFVPSVLSLILARLLCRRSGRVVAVVHDIESGLAKGLGLVNRRLLLVQLQWFERVLMNSVDATVVLTTHMARALREIGVRSPISVLPIWASDIALDSENNVTPGNPPVVMYSGNFGRKQGLHQLLEISQRLAVLYPHVRVIMQGDGTERRALEEEIARCGLHNVIFRKLVPRSELIENLRQADIHLVPQDARAADYALPSKVTSIMAAGRPFVCIAEARSALADIVNASRAGICVRPNDSEAFIGAVRELIEQPELRQEMGENGRRYVREKLDAVTILKQYEQLILGRTAAPSQGRERNDAFGRSASEGKIAHRAQDSSLRRMADYVRRVAKPRHGGSSG